MGFSEGFKTVSGTARLLRAFKGLWIRSQVAALQEEEEGIMGITMGTLGSALAATISFPPSLLPSWELFLGQQYRDCSGEACPWRRWWRGRGRRSWSGFSPGSKTLSMTGPSLRAFKGLWSEGEVVQAFSAD